jgi:hypothetical protein
VAQGVGRGLTIRRHDPPVRAGDGERERRAAAGTRVILEERDPDERLGGEPRLEFGDPVLTPDLDASGVDDRRGQGGRQVRDGFDGAFPVLPGLGAVGDAGIGGQAGGWSRHGVEVEAELELAALRAARRPTRTPALRPAGDPGRRDIATLGHGPQAVRPLFGRLAGDRREPLDERPELVFPEEPDHRVAVVVAEARSLEVDLDRKVADDRRQLATHPDLVHVLAELVAELGGRDLVEPRQERIEVAEVADELGRGLLPHPGHARDVVARVALERLVIDHLIGRRPNRSSMRATS